MPKSVSTMPPPARLATPMNFPFQPLIGSQTSNPSEGAKTPLTRQDAPSGAAAAEVIVAGTASIARLAHDICALAGRGSTPPASAQMMATVPRRRLRIRRLRTGPARRAFRRFTADTVPRSERCFHAEPLRRPTSERLAGLLARGGDLDASGASSYPPPS